MVVPIPSFRIPIAYGDDTEYDGGIPGNGNGYGVVVNGSVCNGGNMC